jgi:hypothetical protein
MGRARAVGKMGRQIWLASWLLRILSIQISVPKNAVESVACAFRWWWSGDADFASKILRSRFCSGNLMEPMAVVGGCYSKLELIGVRATQVSSQSTQWASFQMQIICWSLDYSWFSVHWVCVGTPGVGLIFQSLQIKYKDIVTIPWWHGLFNIFEIELQIPCWKWYQNEFDSSFSEAERADLRRPSVKMSGFERGFFPHPLFDGEWENSDLFLPDVR